MHDDLDFEGKMHDTSEIDIARADLYKLAKYSMKLFKLVEEAPELEGWVQAKITKAADYISSVYHFMEYELKVSEYGDKLENAEMYSESVRRAFVQKLNEAKEKLEKVKEKEKKKHEKELEEEVDKSKIPAAQRKAKGGDWKVSTKDLEKEKTKSPTSPEGLKRRAKEVGLDESEDKADKDYDGDGEVESNKDEVWGSRMKAAAKAGKTKEKKVSEEAKPSAGMSAKEKSAVVKKAKAGKDIGKPGKGFAKVEKAAKAGGAKDPKAVAAAAMWKQQAKK